MNTITKVICSLMLLQPIAACAKQEESPKTQTNEQGCTRIRSTGPQDPYRDPAPLKQACLGPYLLEIPQNYFENQIGTEHDGLFALALEYPSLEPFKPGERMRLTADVSVSTVRVKYSYIDRTDVETVLQRTYTPMEYQKDRPEESLETRIKGDADHGLTPYFVDMDKVRAHYQAEGLSERSTVMDAKWHKDWFIGRDVDDEVSTVIKCTPRVITEAGVEYREGKMVKNNEIGVARCDHTMMMADLDTLIEINYPREGIHQWQTIENRVRELVTGFMVRKNKRGK